jgi:hypothetical protein
MSPIIEEIEHWQSIYDYFSRDEKFVKEAEHVRDLLSQIVLGIKVNPNPQEPSK